jgi:iron complex outermembrane recepter protein
VQEAVVRQTHEWRRSRLGPIGAFAALGALAPFDAWAQRTDENATAQSDDAFGRRVGNESIGIYNAGDVRGFSPIDAGNVRLDGLYIDRQADPTDHLVEGSAIRVGIAAQGYPFPSPTGIVDYEIRRAGDQRIVSPVLRFGPFDSKAAEVDAKIPLIQDRLGVAAGVGLYNDCFEWGGCNNAYSLAFIPRWRPAEGVEIIPFYSHVKFGDEEPDPLLIPANGEPPPRIERREFYGQRWSQTEGETGTWGVLGEAPLGKWTFRLGLFESFFAPSEEFAELFTDIDPTGLASERIIAFQDSRFGSKSGELRASRSFEGTQRLHTIIFTARGRNQTRRYGGEVEIDAGLVQIGVGRQIPRPEFSFTEQSGDEVEQGTAGAAYELRWKDVGEMSVGVQKTFYTKSVHTPDGDLPESRAEPVLVNASGTAYLNETFALYASYTEGLEESPVAPANARNRNVAAPALDTRQYDAGVRWTLTRDFKVIAGIFNVEKPYFDLDPSGFFRSLGTVEHRGVELSLAGSPIENLTLVAGTRFLDAQVSGPTVDAGLIGEEPVGKAKSYSMASLDYALAGTRVSLDAMLEVITSTKADTANTIDVGGRTVLHLGGRYRFNLFDKPATLRMQVHNVFNRFGWVVQGSGAYAYNAPRRLTVYVAADL